MEEIRKILIEKAAELCGADVDTITDTTDLTNELGMTSATMVVMISALEEELDVDIDFMLFRKAATISGIVKYLDDLVNG